MRNPYRIDGPAMVAFSGGRTSGFLLWHILDAHGGKLPADVHVVFANTGKEREATLEFVRDCETHWGVKIHWVEWRLPSPGEVTGLVSLPAVRKAVDRAVAADGTAKQKEKRRKKALREALAPFQAGINFREVAFATASRRGEPFLGLIHHRNFVPNPVTRFCTQELKIRPMKRFMQALGYEHWTNALGIRADEPFRIAKVFGGSEREPYEIVTPLVADNISKPDVSVWWSAQPFDLRLRPWEGNCDLCVSGDTEIVTRDGIVPIRSVAGRVVELLVPKSLPGGLFSEVGRWKSAPVSSFGEQRLWRLTLAGHGRSTKTLYVTGNHRWFLSRPTRHHGRLPSGEVRTDGLRPGDRLRNLFVCPIGTKRGRTSRIGAMRGFVFGDGTRSNCSRPGTLDLHEGKDEVFRPLFEACCGPSVEKPSTTGKRFWHFYGLPHEWTTPPNIRESRHFLIGFLAGWFAADGCVAEDGSCILNTSRADRLLLARSLCAVLGVQASPGSGGESVATLPNGESVRRSLYALRINRFHLTADFFWLDEHRRRFENAGVKEERRYGWTVKSVEPTERVEEVFCATVDGEGAFGLADGLMTGNCFLKGWAKRVRIARDNPELVGWWAEAEAEAEAVHQGVARHPRYSRFRKDTPSYAQIASYVKAQSFLPGLSLDDDPALFEDDSLSMCAGCMD